MGCFNSERYIAPPCTNCGKEHRGVMNSSSWGHSYSCCSDRCGERLAKRIENGMYKPSENPFFPFNHINYGNERIELLRFRIKHLESQLRQNGIKPKSAS